MAKSLMGEASSSSAWGGNARKRKRSRSPSSSSPDSNDSTLKRTGSAQSGDSSKSVEVRPGSLMEALMESKEKGEKVDSSRRHKKSKKKRKEKRDEEESAREVKEEPKEDVVENKPVLEPATVAGAAREELDLTLRKEDLEDIEGKYDTDEEEEAEDRRLRLESQRLRKVERKTVEYTGETRWNHEEVLARFDEDVRGDIARKKEGQQSVPLLHTPSLHMGCKCSRSRSDDRKDSSSSGSDGEESGDSDDAEKKEQRDKRRKASIRKRNKRRKTKQTEAATALIKQEVDWRRHHPSALSTEVVFNVPHMLNESPACRCSAERKEEGIRHNHFMGEKKLESNVQSCSISSLHHYVLSVRPNPSDQLRRRNEMIIQGEEGLPFHFSGFSLLSHRPLPPILPPEPQHKWTDEYKFVLEEDEKLSEQTVGSIRALDSLFSYITEDILELFDLRRWPEEVERHRRSRIAQGTRGSREEEERADGCPIFHVMPRFVRRAKDGSSLEVAPISSVLDHITQSYARPFYNHQLNEMMHSDHSCSFDSFVEKEKEGIVIDATRRPSSIRVDGIEQSGFLKRNEGEDEGWPVIAHQAWRPTPFILAARPDYQKVAAEVAEKKAKLLAGTEPEKRRRGENGVKKEEGEVDEKKISPEEEKQLRTAIAALENQLQKIKNDCMNRREVTIYKSSKHFRRTGFKADLAHHTILLVMMMNHVRFHWALEILEERIAYKFSDRTLIELALSHPSYNANYGTNPDHARNAINLCGVRKPGPRARQHLDGPRVHNEILELRKGRNRKKDLDRLVDLQDYVDDAKKIQLNPGTINERLEFLGDSVVEMIVTVHLFFLLPNADEGLLATFRSSLVQNKNLAALAQEIYLDKLMLMSHGVELLHEPEYRHATANSFEAFMAAVYLDSDKDMDHCERGDHQTLELLGDTILQMATTEFLYKKFPVLHEGHLSLLRTCLVSNKTQSVICDDLDMTKYVLDLTPRRSQNRNLKMKDKADLVESLLGAIYVDRGWEYCRAFARVCFFPRMKFFIDSHAWIDPKSALQQLCLALPRREQLPEGTIGGKMPEYRVIQESGPTNLREYTIACEFRGKRIGVATAKTVHSAQMKAAGEGIKNLPVFFPDEWAGYEQKYFKQRSHRDPIRRGARGGGTQRGESQYSPASFSPHPPYGASSSSHFQPPPSLPPFQSSSSFPFPSTSFNPRLQSQLRGGPPPFAPPIDLMSLSLPPPPSLQLHAPPPPPPPALPFAGTSSSGSAPITDVAPRPQKNRARKEEWKRKEAQASASSSSLPLAGHHSSTSLPPPPQRGYPMRAGGGSGLAPSRDDSLVLPPPPSLPPSGPPHSEWVPLPPRAHPSPHSNHRGSYSSGSRPRSGPHHVSPGMRGSPYSRPPMNGRGAPRGGMQQPPVGYLNERQPSKPKSLLDIPFEDMWGK